ncbi:MAG: glycosyltransferase [Paludibacteraceae bacterium]|nr:glycosyltransferase [Paludibacteraceae bacterium]
MKILFVIDTYDTGNNGTSISAQRFAAELRSRGHEVMILTTGEPGEHRFNVPDFHMPLFQPLMDKHDFNFAKFWGDKALDIIHKAVDRADIVHCFLPFALETTAQRYAQRTGKPCTGAFHIQPENMTSSVNLGKVTWVNELFYQQFRFNMYNNFRHVHCPSQFMADMVIERGYTAKMHVISNGIQDAFLEAGKHHIDCGKPARRPEFEGKKVIMMVGRLSQEKRQDVIINAVQYSRYADQIQLVFAGNGPEKEKYEELGKTLKYPPMFVYLSREQLIDMLGQVDVYVHASDMESEAISCIEAFATALVPVIANSEVSATPQFALDGRSLFLPGNPKDLARAWDYWLDHPNERKYMEQLYYQSAQRYSLSNSVTLFEAMLREEIDDCRRIAMTP